MTRRSSSWVENHRAAPDFEVYLMDVFRHKLPGIPDDFLLHDTFSSWLEQQHIDDIIRWANEYAGKLSKEAA